jgi:hypothetical protein
MDCKCDRALLRMNISRGLPKDLKCRLEVTIIKQRLHVQYFLNLPMNTRS